MPKDGWLKAIRGALGLTAAQLGKRMGTEASGVLHLEKREAGMTATLALLDRAARAMNCRLVWTIVPEPGQNSLSEIVEKRAKRVATKLVGSVDQSMKLESQGVHDKVTNQQIGDLATDLVRNGDPRIWEPLEGDPK